MPPYRVTCEGCAGDLFVTEHVADPEPTNVVVWHLWAEHPDLLREPALLPLAELMRFVRVRMA